jgi:hypothetical protein
LGILFFLSNDVMIPTIFPHLYSHYSLPLHYVLHCNAFSSLEFGFGHCRGGVSSAGWRHTLVYVIDKDLEKLMFIGNEDRNRSRLWIVIEVSKTLTGNNTTGQRKKRIDEQYMASQ